MAGGLRTLHTPGHTPGHCSLVLECESILFAGDIVGTMAGSLSRGPAPFTADAEQAEKSLRRVAALEFDRVLVGGPTGLALILGQFLRAILGYSSTPEVTTLAVHLAYLGIVLALYLRPIRPTPRPTAETTRAESA